MTAVMSTLHYRVVLAVFQNATFGPRGAPFGPRSAAGERGGAMFVPCRGLVEPYGAMCERGRGTFAPYGAAFSPYGATFERDGAPCDRRGGAFEPDEGAATELRSDFRARALRAAPVLDARAAEEVPHRVVPLVARVFVEAVAVFARDREPHGPRRGIDLRVVD